MILLLSSWFFKILTGFFSGSLTNLAVISKTTFLRINFILAKRNSKWKNISYYREFILRNVVFEITAKLVKDPERNPVRILKNQEESSNIIIYIINIIILKNNCLLFSFFYAKLFHFLRKIASFFMQTPVNSIFGRSWVIFIVK